VRNKTNYMNLNNYMVEKMPSINFRDE